MCRRRRVRRRVGFVWWEEEVWAEREGGWRVCGGGGLCVCGSLCWGDVETAHGTLCYGLGKEINECGFDTCLKSRCMLVTRYVR